MTVRHLKIFCTVYLCGNMTAAAKALFMTQPSVSQTIRELESHYEVKLFERLYHRLYPTTAGERLFQYAKNILDMMDEMDQGIKEEQTNPQLRIGLFFTAGMLAHPWLQKFREQHPNTRTRISVYKGSVLKQMLRNSELDFAVMEEIGMEEDLRQELFTEDRLVAVTAKDDPLLEHIPITAETLLNQPLLLREKGAGVRDQVDAQLRDSGYLIEASWESASSLVLLNAAANGEGIAILPYELAKSSLEQKSVAEVPVVGLDFRRRMGITWHKDKYITSLMQDFIDIIKASGTLTAEPSADRH